MKRVLGHVLAGLSVLTLGSVAFSACVHNDSSIFVQDVLAPQQVSNNHPCVFTATPTQTVISSGTLDVDFRSHYDPTYLVGNQLVGEANSQQLVTETSTVTLQGGIVRITDAHGNQLTWFTRLAAATIYPATGGVPSYAPVSITTIDTATIAGLKTSQAQILNNRGLIRLVTYVRFFGNTLGGRYVESDEFEFPVDVCKGCLITFSPADINPGLPIPNCAGNPSAGSTTAQQTLPCQVGQDLPIDCLQCEGLAENPVDCYGNYRPTGAPVDAGGG